MVFITQGKLNLLEEWAYTIMGKTAYFTNGQQTVSKRILSNKASGN